MRIGLMLSFRNPPKWRRPWADVYAEHLDDCRAAEELGYDDVWLTEHHFAEDGYSPSLMTIAGAVASVTKRVRIGMNLLLLPLHHPIRVAEDGATVDVISRGRLDLGVGQGYAREEFAGYGIKRSERAGRMEEGLEIVRKCWTEDRFTYRGKYFQLEDVHLEPRPVQSPPPIWVGGRGPKALDRAARLGCNFLGIGDPSAVGIYEDALRRNGKDPKDFHVAQLVFGHLAETREQAWDEAEEHVHWLLSCYGKWLGEAKDFEGDEQLKKVPPVKELRHSKNLLFIPAIGTPDDVVAYLKDFTSRLRTTHLILGLHLPGLDPKKTRRSMELFAREVMPRIR